MEGSAEERKCGQKERRGERQVGQCLTHDTHKQMS